MLARRLDSLIFDVDPHEGQLWCIAAIAERHRQALAKVLRQLGAKTRLELVGERGRRLVIVAGAVDELILDPAPFKVSLTTASATRTADALAQGDRRVKLGAALILEVYSDDDDIVSPFPSG